MGSPRVVLDCAMMRGCGVVSLRIPTMVVVVVVPMQTNPVPFLPPRQTDVVAVVAAPQIPNCFVSLIPSDHQKRNQKNQQIHLHSLGMTMPWQFVSNVHVVVSSWKRCLVEEDPRISKIPIVVVATRRLVVARRRPHHHRRLPVDQLPHSVVVFVLDDVPRPA